MDENNKLATPKRRTVSAARLYWAITDACERYNLETEEEHIDSLLDALKDDIVEAAR